MPIQPTIQQPTIDKVVIQTYDFRLSSSDRFDFKTTTRQGIVISEKQCLNLPGVNIDVQRDRQGDKKLMIGFNPNNTPLSYVQSVCLDAGLNFDMLQGQVIRTDVERHKQLRYPLNSYHRIIHAASNPRATIKQYKDTLSIGIGTGQIQFYDKSKESKIDIPRIVRCEVRYLKPKMLQMQGVTTFKTLLQADRMQLYISGGTKFLPKLQTIPTGTQIAHLVQLLETCYDEHHRPLTHFLSIVGLEAHGIDTIREVINAASLQKQKRYEAHRMIDRIAGDAIPGGYTGSLIDEIKDYFAA